MKRKSCFIVLFALVATLFSTLPVLADPSFSVLPGANIKLTVQGPITWAAGSTLTLTVTATNYGANPATLYRIYAIMINPWTGQRIVGPAYTAATTTSLATNQSTPTKVYLTIPTTYPNSSATVAGGTFAIMIYAVDNSLAVEGSTGWGVMTY